jgi:2-amino-4-hydroxy-6-hydroxymethyldihydropteridine diphosphokinase
VTKKPFQESYTTFLCLGSNMGDRRKNLALALKRLQNIGEVEGISQVLETDPVGYISQPLFLNQMVKMHTSLSPRKLLTEILTIENALGRTRIFPFAPRTIDIDIIFYEDWIVDQPGLTIPHPRMHERRFVLAPLLELSPELIHPRMKKSISALEAQSLGNIHLA